MSKQATQKEIIEYIREEDFLNNKLSVKEREEIKHLHRELKKWLKSKEEVSDRARRYKKYIKNECSNGTYDYYADTLLFLLESDDLSIIWGYQKYQINSPTLWQWLRKLMDIKNDRVNY